MRRADVIERVVVAYPSGNTTAVIFDDRRQDDRKLLNGAVSKALELLTGIEIEQCCFLVSPEDTRAVARAEMLGGEFCGNATRSVVMLASRGSDATGLVEASGSSKLLRFATHGNVVRLEMPLTAKPRALTEPCPEGILVRLEGITHLVVTSPFDRAAQTGRQVLHRLLDEGHYGLDKEPAVGVTYYNEITREASFCVWVSRLDTVFDETACGSGTSAIGLAMRAQNNLPFEADIKQPSGALIRTSATPPRPGHENWESWISGPVHLKFDGQVALAMEEV